MPIGHAPLRRMPRLSGVFVHGSRNHYRVERHSSLLPRAWVLSNGNILDDLKTTRLAQALGIPFETKQISSSWLSSAAHRHLTNIRSIFSASPSDTLHYLENAPSDSLPRIAIAASDEALPALLEIKQRTRDQAVSVYLGLPNTKLTDIDALVLSRLDQMRLRHLGPARANLENSISTMLPLSGATTQSLHEVAQSGSNRLIAVCIGSGLEPAGYQLLSDDIDTLADGLLQVAGTSPVRILLSGKMHSGIKSMVESRLIRRLLSSSTDSNGTSHPPVNLEVLDYSQPGHPSPETVLGSASQVVVTADDIPSVSLAASLGRPVYISGEERTTRILRNYYRVLDTSNIVRRFYPKGSRYSYMLLADIEGEIDEFSAIRDHEPWAGYNAQQDLENVAAFIHERYRLLNA
ncbi:hypothetical protein LPJ53_000736 [Coemansia erecta]|uniref:Uncharacterized protein n=1 Tax=Coemansia erecta TaxID=147472 RepID=A0A9W7Y7Z7_9FUNG|nr:hypothetical protein LPJ53_000736 [Coemansia erecta]